MSSWPLQVAVLLRRNVEPLESPYCHHSPPRRNRRPSSRTICSHGRPSDPWPGLWSAAPGAFLQHLFDLEALVRIPAILIA
jgi:hypothetical protein